MGDERLNYREEDVKNYDYQAQTRPNWADTEQRSYPLNEDHVKENQGQYLQHPHMQPQNFQGEPLYGYHRNVGGFPPHPSDRPAGIRNTEGQHSGGPRELDRPLGPRDKNLSHSQRQ